MKDILEKFNAKPKKQFGQNFLTDKNILKKIIETAQIKNSDVVFEVGPGTGILTQELAKKAGQVIAVEKDKAMIEILQETLKDFKNIEIIHGDILDFFSSLREGSKATDEAIWSLRLPRRLSAPRNDEFKNYKIVANIPYYLTSPLIRKFLESENQPTEIILMIQKEVAQRICATPPNMNLLAVAVQFYATPKILFNVSKNSFWPIPKVDSAVIKITPHARHCEAGKAQRSNLFFKIVKAGFSHPRKQLASNLASELKIKKEKVEQWMLQNNIQPTQRAQTLSIKDWGNLTLSF